VKHEPGFLPPQGQPGNRRTPSLCVGDTAAWTRVCGQVLETGGGKRRL